MSFWGCFIHDKHIPFPSGDIAVLYVFGFHSSLNDPCLFEVAMDFEFSRDLEVVVPCCDDRDFVVPLGFTSIYVEQLRASLHFPLFHLVIDILRHYEMCLSQLVLNVISCVIAFKLFSKKRGVRSSVRLFCSFFSIKSCPSQGWYYFTLRHGLRILRHHSPYLEVLI